MATGGYIVYRGKRLLQTVLSVAALVVGSLGFTGTRTALADSTAWQTVGSNSSTMGTVYALLNDNGMLIAGAQNGIYSYANGTWTMMSGSPQYTDALVDAGGTLYAGAGDAYVYQNGQWTAMNGRMGSVSSLGYFNGTVYAGSEYGVYDLQGNQWSIVQGVGYVHAVSYVDNTLFAGVRPYIGGQFVFEGNAPSGVLTSVVEMNGQLYAGTAKGQTDVWTDSVSDTINGPNTQWTAMANSPSAVYALVNANGTLYAGTRGNNNDVWAYQSNQWTQLSGSPSNVNSLLVIGNTLYVGSENGVESTQVSSTGGVVSGGSGETAISRSGWTASGSAPGGSFWAPSNAIDGDISTIFGTNTSQSPGQYFQVDMGSDHSINEIVMDSGAYNISYARGYEVFVSDDGVHWGSPVATGSGFSSPETIAFSPVSARYIKVVQTSTTTGYQWSIAEFNVYTNGQGATTAPSAWTGGDSPLPRYGWTATGDGIGYDPAALLDGSDATSYQDAPTAFETTPPYFTVDMGGQQTLNEVQLDPPTGGSFGGALMEVSLSTDGQNWTTPVYVQPSYQNGPVTVSFGTQTARYVKVQLVPTYDGGSWDVAEFNAYNVPTCPSGSTVSGSGELSTCGWSSSGTQAVGDTADGSANAIDGNASGHFSTGAAQVPGQYFEVNMGSAQSFNQIVMDSGSSSGDYARGYDVYVSNDGTNWGSPIATGTGTASPETVTFDTQNAQFIKVVQTGNASSNWWSMAAFHVYLASQTLPPVLPETPLSTAGWIATGTSAGSDVPPNAIDGNLSTRFSTDALQQPGQYFEVNMLTPQKFNQIVLDSGASATDYARGYAVYVSNDGQNWGTPVATGTGSGSPQTITFDPQTAQYIKVVQTGSNNSYYWSIAEFHVNTDGLGSTAQTAISRTGWIVSGTQTQGDGSDVPQNAIDGDINTRFSTGTVQTHGQYFEVNMGTIQNFDQLVLDSGPSAGDYARGYAVYVSDDGQNWGNPVASGTGSSSPQTINFAPQNAQYIKIVQTGNSSTNYWSIAEFNVYTSNLGSGLNQLPEVPLAGAFAGGLAIFAGTLTWKRRKQSR